MLQTETCQNLPRHLGGIDEPPQRNRQAQVELDDFMQNLNNNRIESGERPTFSVTHILA